MDQQNFPNRDIRTLDTVSEEALSAIRTKTVAVIGSGGLGGFVIEMLARFGVGHLIIIDKDVFDETNLNRQLLAKESNLGKLKVEEAADRVKAIRSDITVTPIHSAFSLENGIELIKGADLAVDCVDNIKVRFDLAEVCKDLNIPMIHGAVGAWQGQVMTLLPGDRGLEKIYGSRDRELPPSNAASFIPALVASYQVGECIKVMTGKGDLLRNQLMIIDMLHNEHFVVELEETEEKE